MIPVPNLELVLIIPEKVEKTMKIAEDKELEKSEMQMQNEKKVQSRGKIFAVGKNVEFWEAGDLVSFYRAAATEITEEGTEYLSIHQSNVLVKFVTHVER